MPLDKIIVFISEKIVWDTPLVMLCLFSGLYFSFKTKFLQVRLLGPMIRLIFDGKASSNGISSFQALALTLSGRIGAGNIAGTAIAIYYGGPGSIFWMWVISFLGTCTAFIESSLAQLYKEEIDGEYRGGPAYYIEKGIGSRIYALIFAFIMVISYGLLLPGVQSNVFTSSFNNALGLSRGFIGVILTLLLALIILGGVKRISQAAEFIAPFMTIAYMGIAIYIIGLNIQALPQVLGEIVRSAFSLDATFGGIWGSAIAWGVKRGIFSNEAGQGSAPHLAAAAEVSHPAKQGLIQAFSVYVNTIFVCTTTGLMILMTGFYNVINENTGKLIVNNLPEMEKGVAFAQAAFTSVFPNSGAMIVALALGFFSFTSLMVQYYQAESNLAYVFRKDSFRFHAMKLLRFLFLSVVFSTSVWPADLAWAVGDIAVGLLYLINIIAILLLQSPAISLLKDYERQRKENRDPVFDPWGFAAKNTGLWLEIKRRRY